MAIFISVEGPEGPTLSPSPWRERDRGGEGWIRTAPPRTRLSQAQVARGNRPFAREPGDVRRHVDHGGLSTERGATAVQHQVDAISEVVDRKLRGRWRRHAMRVRAGTHDRDTDGPDQGARQGMPGNTQGDGVTAAGYSWRHTVGPRENERQRSRPEATDQLPGCRAGPPGVVIELDWIGQQHRQRLCRRPALDGKNALHCFLIVDTAPQPVDRIGRIDDYLSLSQRLDRPSRRLAVLTRNAEDGNATEIEWAKIRKGKIVVRHRPTISAHPSVLPLERHGDAARSPTTTRWIPL